MAKYRKKSVVVDAMQWDGNNGEAVVTWAQGGWRRGGIWIKQKVIDADAIPAMGVDWAIVIPTLEGSMEASPGDWIVRDDKGELYPCKPDIFDATYEPAPVAETEEG